MKNDVAAPTLKQAIQKLFQNRSSLEKKQIYDLYAPPLLWGPWVHTTFAGGNEDRYFSVSYDIVSEAQSSFDVEIDGAGQVIRDIGPGSTTIKIPGGVWAEVSIRARSHSLGLHIRVSVY